MVELNAETGLPEPHISVSCGSEFRKWLEANFGQADGVWLVTYKKSAGPDRFVDRWDVLDELLCFGWIDGRRLKVSDDHYGGRTAQFISPRRQQKWTEKYRERFERLLHEGRMAAPGIAAAELAKRGGLWKALPDVDALTVPEDLQAALDHQDASAWFDAAAPSYRRNVLRFLATAKKAETRVKRVAIIANHAARGQKVPNY